MTIKIELIDCTKKDSQLYFDSVKGAFDHLHGEMCRNCLTTQSEFLENVKNTLTSVKGMDSGLTLEEVWEDVLHFRMPDGWENWPNGAKLSLLMGTDCGCEYELNYFDV